MANAGTGASELVVDMSLAEWRRVVSADLDGAFVCLQRAARRMVAAGRGGRLIGVTSVHEHQPRVGSAAYDAAEHGLGGLLETMALELGRDGITVNAVAPGEIATPMTGQTDVDPTGVDRPGIPLGRPGDAWEIASVITFLASPAAGYRDGRLLGRRRRHAADGSAGGVAPAGRQLAERVAGGGLSPPRRSPR